MQKDYPYSILIKVRKPSRYTGKEPFFKKKAWEDAKLKLVFVYPDLYEVGRSHLGINILTWLINKKHEWIADFAFAVAPDFEKELKNSKIPLLSWNYRKPLKEFDGIGISYAYELLVTNILQILELSGIPFRASERDESHPVVFGGGPSCGNPEPIAEFFDFFIIGEAEEVIYEVAELITAYKEKNLDKESFLKELLKLEGIYVPKYKNRVKRLVVSRLDKEEFLWDFGVSTIPLSHDRIPMEISRGCTRGCRFCEASFYYRPVREKPPEFIVKHIKQNFELTGYTEASLMSLSAGDYTSLKTLIRLLDREFYSSGDRKFSFSLPSLRVGSIDEEILEFIKFGRKAGLTFAPEAGTERLRRAINKDIEIDRLVEDAKLAWKLGWKKIKLYFMIGLPTETEEDLLGIVELYRRLKKELRKMDITVSASTFIPKPHTPFQWERQISVEESYQKVKLLKKHLGRAFKYHQPEQSFLEGVIARGDRSLYKVILRAYELGARLDSWKEFFSLDTWLRSAEAEGISLEDYLRERDPEDSLPWEHIDLGVKKDFLLREREKAYRAELTRDCRFFKCSKCGVCNKEVKNVLFLREFNEVKTKSLDFVNKEEEFWWWKLYYTKLEDSAFLSQLEIARLFIHFLNKEKIPLAYTSGFHPHPKSVLPGALPVGVESEEEVIAFAVKSKEGFEKLIGATVYPGMKILKVEVTKEKPNLQSSLQVFEIRFLKELKLRNLNYKDVEFEVGEGRILVKSKAKNFSVQKFLKGLTGLERPLKVAKVRKLTV
ncbi:MAG: DUF2344 domain-containing protein [Thermodesulfobacteria bacterium]|nr:DUF2344 domain-containing protein [Thermodesulfobacteriota bacterium]